METIFNFIKNYSLAFLLMLLLVMLFFPLPAMALDVLFTFNITCSLLIFLAATSSKRPIELTSFPVVILFATLLRLALNVAAARVVLINGYLGTLSAGQIINALGDILVGNNFVIGLVIFSILIIINFIVVTKGATRISEVSARFVLDALPGKQLSIDSGLANGSLDIHCAEIKRQELNQEAEFYGRMDGASKFIRGDAIAGILILGLNLIAGILIGIWQHNLSWEEAVQIYTVLTIGDGLAAQIPAYILSIAAAICISRVSEANNLSSSILKELTGHQNTILIAAVILLAFCLIPGMPKLIIISFSLVLGLFYHYLKKQSLNNNIKNSTVIKIEEPIPVKIISNTDFELHPVINLQLGLKLIQDVNIKCNFLEKVTLLKNEVSKKLGFQIPAIKITDNVNLSLNGLQIYINAIKVFDSSFDISKNNLNSFFSQLERVIIAYSYEIFGSNETLNILDKIKNNNFSFNKSLEIIPVNIITKLFKSLLYEKISLTPVRVILESLIEIYSPNKEYKNILSELRLVINKFIIQEIYHAYKIEDQTLYTLLLDQEILKSISNNKNINKIKKLVLKNLELAYTENAKNYPIVLVVDSMIRFELSLVLNLEKLPVYVLAYEEIPSDVSVKVIAKIKFEELA